MTSPDLTAQLVIERYLSRGLQVATAESCTGGLVGAALTDVAGSSAVFERGFITYSNEAKMAMLGVPSELLAKFGAVSREVALAMAEGALVHSLADVAVSITGIAGPGGGSDAKPVGLVHFGLARRGFPTRHVERQFGYVGRGTVRLASVNQALELFLSAIA